MLCLGRAIAPLRHSRNFRSNVPLKINCRGLLGAPWKKNGIFFTFQLISFFTNDLDSKYRSNFDKVDVAPAPPPTIPTPPTKKCSFQVEEINIGISSKVHAYSHMMPEKLCSKDTNNLYTFIKSKVRKWQSQSRKSDKNKFKNYIQTISTSADPIENLCKLSKRPV